MYRYSGTRTTCTTAVLGRLFERCSVKKESPGGCWEQLVVAYQENFSMTSYDSYIATLRKRLVSQRIVTFAVFAGRSISTRLTDALASLV